MIADIRIVLLYLIIPNAEVIANTRHIRWKAAVLHHIAEVAHGTHTEVGSVANDLVDIGHHGAESHLALEVFACQRILHEHSTQLLEIHEFLLIHLLPHKLIRLEFKLLFHEILDGAVQIGVLLQFFSYDTFFNSKWLLDCQNDLLRNRCALLVVGIFVILASKL